MNNIIITVGLPRSGKSTWAIKQGHPIVSRDSIRLAVHNQPYIEEFEPYVTEIQKLMVESLFNSGHKTIILDGCHLKQSYIDTWKKDYNVSEQYFGTPASICKQRAKDTNQEYLIAVINRMMKECDVEKFKEVYQKRTLKKKEFFDIVFKMIKRDNSYFNVISQVTHDYNLNGTEVGEWVKSNPTMLAMVQAEYQLKEKNINDLF